MSSTSSSSNLTAGFIDLATFDELEKVLYGGDNAVSYFVRKVRKATWFTVCPVVLSKSSGIANWNQIWSVNISRAGDYLLRCFLRVTLPQVQAAGTNQCIRWTRNLMHNLCKEVSIMFNDMAEMRLDSYFLDFWSQFSIPAGKRNGYNNMIGSFDDLISHTGIPGNILPAVTLNLPLPLCHCRDTGVALPTAALPYNDMKIQFNFRDISQLLIVDNVGASLGSAGVSKPAAATDIAGGVFPAIVGCDVWAEYAIVSNTERAKMGVSARDILIEQVQTVPPSAFTGLGNASTDIRLSHAIKALFFAVRNKTNSAEWSNYTAASPFTDYHKPPDFAPGLAADPISTVSLLYENTQRLSNMGADYFSLMTAWYSAVSIPSETGYHYYPYTLDLMSINPMGSTNFGKLANVALQIAPSAAAQTAAASSGGTFLAPNIGSIGGTAANLLGVGLPQTFETVICALNHNVVRVLGGTLGFPII